MKAAPDIKTATDGLLFHSFFAMGSPCEVLIDSRHQMLAAEVCQIVEAEARRVEAKFSRYRPDSELSRMNRSAGGSIRVDPETAALIDYASHLYSVSSGLFDITSGVLRRVWQFDGSDRAPSRSQVAALLPLIGWDKVVWRTPELALPRGMELDLGGLGKEYAVDCAVLKVLAATSAPVLVNFGGDLRVSGPRADGGRWRVAIDSVDDEGPTKALLEIAAGALTTSGDARRFLLKDGVRYGHILDPRTGWPVEHCPRSITVAAPTCVEAGALSTLAMLQGADAEKYLAREGIQAWWIC